MDMSPGTLVQNRYRLVRLIGQGKMGAVYEAFDEHLAQTIALKQTLTSGESFSKAFEGEAKMLAGLRHPVLPIVIDHFTNDLGQFMVMDYIPGKDLGDLMRQRDDPFSVQAVLKWADQILHALEYLHRQQPPIIHRDIKPQNLKLTAEGQIILLDFGLAKGRTTLERRDYQLPRARKLLSQVAEGDEQEELEAATDMFGFTRQYAPLEQIQGTGTDPRSDIYALSATLYHLLTGAPPVEALKRLQACGYDNYSHYETGLATFRSLLEELEDQSLIPEDLATYKQQLQENIELARLYGDNPTSQAERSDIIEQLDTIARATVGYSFNRLCRIDFTPDVLEYDPIYPLDDMNPKVPAAISEFIHRGLSLNVSQRPTSAAAMRAELQAAQQTVAQQPASEGAQDDDNSYSSSHDTFLPPHPEHSSDTLTLEDQQGQRRKSEKILVGIIVAILITQVILVAFNHSSPASSSESVPAVQSGTPMPAALVAIDQHNAAQVSQLASWTEHTEDVQGVAFSPDGEMLASGSADNSIHLWHVRDGTVAQVLRGHTDNVTSVAFSPDGQVLASGSDDDTVILWEWHNGSHIRTLREHTDNVTSVAFSPDGTLLATASADNTVRVWQMRDSLHIRTLTDHTGTVMSVAFSPDGTLLATGSVDNTARVWSVRDGSLIRTLSDHTDDVQYVAFSASGTLLATGSADNTARVWSVRDGSLLHTLENHNGKVNSITFLADDFIITGASDDTLRIWQVRDGSLAATLAGHTGEVRGVAVAANRQLIATASEDNSIRLWGIPAGDGIRRKRGRFALVGGRGAG